MPKPRKPKDRSVTPNRGYGTLVMGACDLLEHARSAARPPEPSGDRPPP